MQTPLGAIFAVTLVLGLALAPDGSSTDTLQPAHIEHRYHFTFDTWTTQVVRLRIETLPGSDVVAQHDLSVLRCAPAASLEEGVFAHFVGGTFAGNLSSYSFLQWSIGDDPLILVHADDATVQSPGITGGTGCGGGILSYLFTYLWRGGVYERYWSTQGGSGQLYLNITGTHGLVSYDLDVLDGATFLRPVDFDGVAAHANLLWTNVDVSAAQTATVPTSGPTMGHSSFQWLSEATCMAPDGRDCHNQAFLVEDPGTWDFAIDYSIGLDSPMWYVGAVFPR